MRLVLKKYKAIKLYHESEDIKKQYKFYRPEVFLRGILKYITKFQPCEIIFDPYFPEHKKLRRNTTITLDPTLSRDDESLSLLISTSSRLEE